MPEQQELFGPRLSLEVQKAKNTNKILDGTFNSWLKKSQRLHASAVIPVGKHSFKVSGQRMLPGAQPAPTTFAVITHCVFLAPVWEASCSPTSQFELPPLTFGGRAKQMESRGSGGDGVGGGA